MSQLVLVIGATGQQGGAVVTIRLPRNRVEAAPIIR